MLNDSVEYLAVFQSAKILQSLSLLVRVSLSESYFGYVWKNTNNKQTPDLRRRKRKESSIHFKQP